MSHEEKPDFRHFSIIKILRNFQFSKLQNPAIIHCRPKSCPPGSSESRITTNANGTHGSLFQRAVENFDTSIEWTRNCRHETRKSQSVSGLDRQAAEKKAEDGARTFALHFSTFEEINCMVYHFGALSPNISLSASAWYTTWQIIVRIRGRVSYVCGCHLFSWPAELMGSTHLAIEPCPRGGTSWIIDKIPVTWGLVLVDLAVTAATIARRE